MLPDKRPEISICICTFRRPKGLRRLLESVRRLDVATPAFEVIVVDNDERATAGVVISQFQADGLGKGIDLHYLVEPVQNIARARNRSVRAASGTYVAFIDDDEEADPLWLISLWRAIRSDQADGGFGPVISRFTGDVPRWVVEGRFFDRPRFPTGTALPWYRARTGNALIRRETLMAMSGMFDETFGLTGGEDSDLFWRLWVSGSKFIAVDEAILIEHVPPSRASVRWLARREFRIGSSLSRFELSGTSLLRPLWFLPATACHAVLRVAIAVVLLPFSRIGSMRLGILPAARAAGKLAGVAGYSVYDYAHSSDGWRE